MSGKKLKTGVAHSRSPRAGQSIRLSRGSAGQSNECVVLGVYSLNASFSG